MSLREILHLTKQPPESNRAAFGAQTIKVLVSLIIQLVGICEDQDIELSKQVHAFDLKSNEWHIAALQVYETLFRQEASLRHERGEIKFDLEGEVIPPSKGETFEVFPTISAALRPLLEFIDGYRRRVAAPENTRVHKKYTKYADLSYIQKRLWLVEDQIHRQLYNQSKIVGVDFVGGEYKNLNANVLNKNARVLTRKKTADGFGDKNCKDQTSDFTNLNQNQKFGRTSSQINTNLSDKNQRLEIQTHEGRQNGEICDLSDQQTTGGKTVSNVLNKTTNQVTVEFIEAEYHATDQKGFQKRLPPGYSGGIAKTEFSSNQQNSGQDTKNLNERDSTKDGAKKAKPGKFLSAPKMTDNQVKEIMLNDPEASKFLAGIISGEDRYGQNFKTAEQTVECTPKGGVRMKTSQLKKKKARNLNSEGYKWPYFDSYAPGLDMNTQDKVVVKRNIQKQYFPNEQGTFNVKELKQRKSGIKKIEMQYLDKIKTAMAGGDLNRNKKKFETTLSKNTVKSPLKHMTQTNSRRQEYFYSSHDARAGQSSAFSTQKWETGLKTNFGSQLNSVNRLAVCDEFRDGVATVSAFSTVEGGEVNCSPVHKYRRRRPLDDMLDAHAQSLAAAELSKQPKIKFPLLKGDDHLDILLSDLLEPEGAKKIISGSAKVAEEADDIILYEGMEDLGNGILALPGSKFIVSPEIKQRNQNFVSKSKSLKKNSKAKTIENLFEDHLKHSNFQSSSDLQKGQQKEKQGDRIMTKKSKDSVQCADGDIDKNTLDIVPTRRKLFTIKDVERYCRPHHLSLYNPIDSGFKYNVIGLFGLPDQIQAAQPCVYTVLASVFPPGEPYKQKPTCSMFGANFFCEIDFDRSMHTSQFFKQEEDVELSGVVIKLKDTSCIIFDIKRLNLTTGEMNDYGFAIQPLTHRLKQRSYLIGGRYQMPVYRGSLPSEFLAACKIQDTLDNERNPKLIFKHLVNAGKIQPHGNMQIVSQIADLNPPEDQQEIPKISIPSMLHHFNKSNLEAYSLENIFSRYDKENASYIEKERFAPLLTNASIFKKPADVTQAAKIAFRDKYMV